MGQLKENTGLSLIKKGKKSLVSAIFSRFGLIVLLILAQIAAIIGIFWRFEEFLPHIYGVTFVFTIAMMLYLLNSRSDPSAKLTWLGVILLVPVFGALFYLYTQLDIGHRALKNRTHQLSRQTRGALTQNTDTLRDLQADCPGAAALSRYIARSGCYPVYHDTAVTYFPSGEAKFQALLEQLEQARHFIFMEYFIINEGMMWGRILEVLARKAAQGVEVRVMYDGTCEFAALPHSYPKKLAKLGIRCKAFAPLSPFVSTHYNYRDHRKIVVIDGHTAFTGGINLADEYINRLRRFGHWKDTAVMLQGSAARSFTMMFLQMWSIDEDRMVWEKYMLPVASRPARGYVIPYGDCPLDSEKVGEQVYIDILNRAQRYVHIMTPYLIVDGETENALRFAAQRGVDVRLILPGIPDKFIPFSLALTHYGPLLEAGVKIYEYTPGFIHAKSFVCDDREAVVGTINLDYRSLYHHFECAVYMYDTHCIEQIAQDFLQTQRRCRPVESVSDAKTSRKVVGFLMKGLSPLL